MGNNFDTAMGVATLGTYTLAKGLYDITYGIPKENLEMQKKAQATASASALKQEKAGDEAMNRANQKRPDTTAIMAAAQTAAKTGGASTMLTGPQGIDPTSLQLGKTSLLGS